MGHNSKYADKAKSKAQKAHEIHWKFYDFINKKCGIKGLTEHEIDEQMVGWDLMEKIERYVKRNPQIKIVYVDDEMFSSSMLVLIPHPEMGVSVKFIPQNSNVKGQFFLYHNHLKNLMSELKHLEMSVYSEGSMSKSKFQKTENNK